MERLTVNDMLKETISKIDHELLPEGFVGDQQRKTLVQQELSKLIDAIGEKSTKAQQLGSILTTAEKLQSSPTHILYLLKDSYANGGAGELIGLLKVAKKDLYLLNPDSDWVKSSPLCILDFYVASDKQRRGLGKQLFDHMLVDWNLDASDVAIDFPSKKMEQFLQKHYDLKHLLRQNNKFAVPQEFFGVVSTNVNPVKRPKSPSTFGRFGAPKPPSQIADIIHGSAWTENTKLRSRVTTPDPETVAGSSTTSEAVTETKDSSVLPANSRSVHRPTRGRHYDLKYGHVNLW